MQYRAESLGLAGSVTTILLELIHDRLGLSYEPNQVDQVADRLAPLVVARGLDSFLEYYYLLKYSDETGEWGRVMDALAVQETYFWREIDQIRAVVECVVPRLVETHAGRALRIWSAPCATGEEPLTLAMVLDQAGWFSRAPIEIVASDASRAAITKAERGEYSGRAFRNLSPDLKARYFTPVGDRWIVDPELRQHVAYDVVNLVAPDEVARHAAAPVIFCRNVFIYFSEQSIRRVLDAFDAGMPSPGFLCVGASESLLRLGTPFELEEIGGSFIYVRHRSEGRPVAVRTLQSQRV